MSRLLFSKQESLGKLPVPSLEETCVKYSRSLLPLIPSNEVHKVEEIISKFQNGIGKELQDKLIERSKKEDNWLSEWWLKYAYLIWRCPIPINVNTFFLFDEAISKEHSQISLASRIIYHTLEFYRKVEAETIEPDHMKSGNSSVPLCMDQFRYLFTTYRLPGINLDTIKNVKSSQQVIVISNGHFFLLDTFSLDGLQTSLMNIESLLEVVLIDSMRKEPTFKIGPITAGERNKCATIRKRLIEFDPINSRSFEEINQALFVLVLDQESPNNDQETAHKLLVGDSNNRYFDKVFQFIVFANARCGLNGEHSPLDAPTTGKMADYVLSECSKPRPRELYISPSPQVPKRLRWKFPSDIVKELREMEESFSTSSHELDLKILNFNLFGARFVRENTISGPDAFFQMALQLAYYRLHQTVTATYETAQTRKFLKGRTETIRSLSRESLDFVKIVNDSNASPADKLSALHKAISRHVITTNEAVNGKGVDRHLLGLRIIALESGVDMPEMFTDASYSIGTHFRLSTSNLNGRTYLPGFGPVVEDGYGICYRIKNESLQVCITCFQSSSLNAQSMKDALQTSLSYLYQLIVENKTPSKL